MSTNFYFRSENEPEYADVNHIGLSTSQLFIFHALPKKGLTTFAAWKKHLQVAGRVIVDEYNHVRAFDDFVKLVESSKNGATCAEYRNSPVLAASVKITSQVRRYRDEEGHMFSNYVFS